jgi:hypothetical protein
MFALDICLIVLLEVMAYIAKKKKNKIEIYKKKIASWKDDTNMSP